MASASAMFRYLEAFHDEGAESERVEGTAFIPTTTDALRGLYEVDADFVRLVQRRSPEVVSDDWRTVASSGASPRGR